MKDFISEYYNEKTCDGFSFEPNTKGHLEIVSFNVKTDGELVVPGDLGYKYHVLLYKLDSNNKRISPDLYDAVLGDPVSYIAGLLKCGWFGVICKKSKNSYDPIDRVYKSILADNVELSS